MSPPGDFEQSSRSAVVAPPRRRSAGKDVCAGLVVFLFAGSASAWAYDNGARVYFNADSCRAAHALSDAECANAYANAKAEFDEKAPRFSTRGDCGRHFQRCMIGDILGGRGPVDFIPAMRGFRVERGRQRRVVPVAEGAEADPLFQPRAVDSVDSSVSAVRRAQAQKAWQALTSAPPRAATAAGAAPTIDDPGESSDATGPRSFPLSPSMLQDLKDRERLYGLDRKPQ